MQMSLMLAVSVDPLHVSEKSGDKYDEYVQGEKITPQLRCCAASI